MVKRDKNGKLIIKVLKKKNSSNGNPESIELADPHQELQNRVEFMQQQLNQAYELINMELNHSQNGAGGSGSNMNNRGHLNEQGDATEEELEEKIEKLQSDLSTLTSKLDELRNARIANQGKAKKQKYKRAKKAIAEDDDPTDPSSSDDDSSDQSESDSENEPENFNLPHIREPVKVDITGGNLVGTSASNKLKKKIWAHKYIDFFDLLPSEDPSQYSLQFKPDTKQASLQFIRKPKRAINRTEWLSAWDEYMTIFAQKHHKHLTHMLTYAKTIRSMMAANYNWLMYDEAFRRRRETANNQDDPTSWTELKLDLYLLAMTKPNNSFRDNTTYQPHKRQAFGNKFYVPPGYCYAYHDRTQYCQNTECSFHHYCPNKFCHKEHPVYMCKKNRGNNAQQGRGNQYQGYGSNYQRFGQYQGPPRTNTRGQPNRGNNTRNAPKQRNSRPPSPNAHQS